MTARKEIAEGTTMGDEGRRNSKEEMSVEGRREGGHLMLKVASLHSLG